MSEPAAEPLIPPSHADLLEGITFAHVATVGPSGEPHSNPVWFEWDGEFLRFSVTTRRQKLANVEREPRIALSIMDPANPYRYLELRGRVDGVEDDSANAFIDKMANKYVGHDRYRWAQPGDQRVVIRVKPEHSTQMG